MFVVVVADAVAAVVDTASGVHFSFAAIAFDVFVDFAVIAHIAQS